MCSLTATLVARWLFLPGLKSRGFQAVRTSFLEAGLWWFFHRLENNVFIWLGPAIADLTHLLKDGYLQRYGVMGILLGKPERLT
ncbi:MAG: hypothetical protein AAGG53_15720 [Cyanobacteria bacterium P01_H01_bin.152]